MHTQSTVLDTPPEGGAQRRENIEHPTNPRMDCRHAREKQGSQTWHTALWRGQRAGGRRGKEGQARASDADAVEDAAGKLKKEQTKVPTASNNSAQKRSTTLEEELDALQKAYHREEARHIVQAVKPGAQVLKVSKDCQAKSRAKSEHWRLFSQWKRLCDG